MDKLLEKVKANLILEHSEDDALLKMYIDAAVSYAESYQHIPEGSYSSGGMPPTTQQAVIMLASHFYESRDGSTGGFFADNVQAGEQVFKTVNLSIKNAVVKALLAAEFTVTNRQYIGFEADTGYHHYNVDVANYYETEDI